MRKTLPLLLSGLLPLSFTNCNSGGSSGTISGTGPFDSSGNYVEEWADNPAKWNGRSVPHSDPPTLASTTQSQTTTVVQRPAPVRPTSSSTTTTTVRPQTTTKVVTKPKPKPTPKPKPKPVAQFVYHTVKRGDTLFGLAKRYGTTVAKVQKANGFSGSTIRIGQRLKIPR